MPFLNLKTNSYKAKFILRLDDICPRMDWKKFERMKKIIDAYAVRPIIGVIPNNKDETLMIDPPKENFWRFIKQYQVNGWTIAQHGYEHLYHTQNGGIFKNSKKSEFAGLSYKKQVAMLSVGKQFLQKKEITSDLFMAPSHSIDQNTIKALKATGFQYITDGYGLFPYDYQGLTFLPQLFASPLNFGMGVYTICLHTNTLGEKEFQDLALFIKQNAAAFLSLEESLTYKTNHFLNTTLSTNFFKYLRQGKIAFS